MCCLNMFGLAMYILLVHLVTPGSMNSLFSDFVREFWRGVLEGILGHLGETLGGF